jgi:hypothetical protein
MELLKAYPKDISLVIEIPLKEMEMFLDYLDHAEIVFDGEKEPEFQSVIDSITKLIKSLDEMVNSVRNYPDA